MVSMTLILNKTIAFESTLATAFNRGALFASDQPDGYDFEGLSHRLADQLPVSIPKRFINRADPDSHNVLIADLNTGRYLVNYSGHGSTGIWASNAFFGNTDAFNLTNAPNYSVFTLLTCLNGYFLNTNDALAENSLKAPNGGAVAMWASTGKTTPDVQEVMATRFYSQISTSNMVRIGDYIQDAKQSLIGGRDVRLSWALLGDPTLKIK